GCRYVILGHSERRRHFYETSELINKKIQAVLSYDILPILCIGETLEERKNGRMSEVIEDQIDKSISSLPASGVSGLVIAYEPVWAIGTGKAATAKEVGEAHRFIREKMDSIFKGSGSYIRILYGGSVTPENIGWIMAEPDVDGVLVGNASLKAESFVEIIKKSIEGVK
ncbi:MAG: triose-phosphate isomerase, partial [Nitrospirota bacterium]